MTRSRARMPGTPGLLQATCFSGTMRSIKAHHDLATKTFYLRSTQSEVQLLD